MHAKTSVARLSKTTIGVRLSARIETLGKQDLRHPTHTMHTVGQCTGRLRIRILHPRS